MIELDDGFSVALMNKESYTFACSFVWFPASVEKEMVLDGFLCEGVFELCFT